MEQFVGTGTAAPIEIRVESVYSTIESIVATLFHSSSSYFREGDLMHGTTNWESASIPKLKFQWDWAEIKPRVVAYINAPRVISNIQLVDSRGEIFEPCERDKALALLIYLLTLRSQSWQQTVLDSAPPHV